MLRQRVSELRELVASCPSFQAWVGAADTTNARTRVHVCSTARQPELPFALIDIGDGFERERVALTLGKPFAEHAQLLVYLRAAAADTEDDAEAMLAFCDQIDALWADIETRSSMVATLPVQSISLAAAPTRISEERRPHAGDYFEAVLSLSCKATH